MKKIFLIILTLITIMQLTGLTQALMLSYDGITQNYDQKPLTLKVNNNEIKSDMPPIILKDRSLVPVRAVFEKLGAKVAWDSKNKKVTVGDSTISIKLKINDQTAVVNGKNIKMDVPAKIINDRTLVPLRFVGEQLNMKVGWFPDKNLITIDGSIRDLAVNTNRGGSNGNTGYNNVQVEYSQQVDHEELNILLNDYNNYNIFRLNSPDRLVVDIPNASAPLQVSSITTNGNIIKGVRYAQSEKGYVRIVMDVNGQPEYKIFEQEGKLVLHLISNTYKNISYINHETSAEFILKNVNFINLGDIYTENYDKNSNNYTLTFQPNVLDVGSGTMDINDSYMEFLNISTDQVSGQTCLQFKGKKANLNYSIIKRQSSNEISISISNPNIVSKRLVVIDPGHGGNESGAVYDGIKEKDLNLDIALRLNKLLKSKNINTYMTRETDKDVGLYERANIANNLNASLFISIHNNAFESMYKGTETLFFPSGPAISGINSKSFAQIIQDQLISNLGTVNRGIVERPNLVVLRATNMPAALAEIAFMTNSQDMTNLKSDTFKQKAAQALCDAVIKTLSKIN